MVSRRQFLFGAAAGSVAITLPQGMAGKIISALLSPSPAPALVPNLPTLASILQSAFGEFKGSDRDGLGDGMITIIGYSSHSYDFVPTGHKSTDMQKWALLHEETVMEALETIVEYMRAIRTKDLEAERLKAHADLTYKIENLQSWQYPDKYYNPALGLMDKFESHETVMNEISNVFEHTMHRLAQSEKMKPVGIQSRPLPMDDLYMVLRPTVAPILQNSASFPGPARNGCGFTEPALGFYNSYTLDNLKFWAELKFLHRTSYLARMFELPEKEQAILDAYEANPANWARLIKRQSYHFDGDATIERLNAAFPERMEKARVYLDALEKEKNKHDLSCNEGELPNIAVPWNIVLEMQDRPDAFIPLIQPAVDKAKQDYINMKASISLANRLYYSKANFRKAVSDETFTKTVSGKASFQNMQGILRGFFAIYPDKERALELLRNAFSTAVNLVADGDDILLEAKPEMNEQDRLLLEDLSGMKLNDMAFAMPLKEPVPNQ